MDNERGLEALSWDEFEQAVVRFIAADGPGTDDLPADEFFALWARFGAERRQRVVEDEGESDYATEGRLCAGQPRSSSR